MCKIINVLIELRIQKIEKQYAGNNLGIYCNINI